MLTQRQSGLSVLGSYLYLHEADIAKALLDSYGIESFILDEHQIRQRWHLGVALGGVKLAVAPEHAYRARQVLEEDRSDVLEDIEEQQLPAHEDELCPRCGSAKTRAREARTFPGIFQWAASLFFLFLGVLAPRRRIRVSRECAACDYAWSMDETR